MIRGAVFILLVLLIGCMPDSDIDKVRTVNSQVNNMLTYRTDRDEHWQTLAETLRLRTGDCEDYAIAKYEKLLARGIPESDLKIAVGSYKGKGHAWLMYKDLVLDYDTNDTKRLDQRPDLKLLYILDSLDEVQGEIARRN